MSENWSTLDEVKAYEKIVSIFGRGAITNEKIRGTLPHP